MTGIAASTKAESFGLVNTIIVIAPRSFAYAALGGHLDNLTSPEALIALGILVGMAIFGLVLVARDRRRESAAASAAVPPPP